MEIIWAFIRCSFVVLICLTGLFCSDCAAEGTLEDIRNETGWQSPVHSERYASSIPVITPAELLSYLDKYHRDTVKMQCLFNRISTIGLSRTKGGKWPSKRYILFRIKDPNNQINTSVLYLYLHKKSPYADLLLSLQPDTPILINGVVKDVSGGKACIEVKEIEKQ